MRKDANPKMRVCSLQTSGKFNFPKGSPVFLCILGFFIAHFALPFLGLAILMPKASEVWELSCTNGLLCLLVLEVGNKQGWHACNFSFTLSRLLAERINVISLFSQTVKLLPHVEVPIFTSQPPVNQPMSLWNTFSNFWVMFWVSLLLFHLS